MSYDLRFVPTLGKKLLGNKNRLVPRPRPSSTCFSVRADIVEVFLPLCRPLSAVHVTKSKAYIDTYIKAIISFHWAVQNRSAHIQCLTVNKNYKEVRPHILKALKQTSVPRSSCKNIVQNKTKNNRMSPSQYGVSLNTNILYEYPNYNTWSSCLAAAWNLCSVATVPFVVHMVP